MVTPSGRAGYVHGGVLVEFRLNTRTGPIVWESSMNSVPQVDWTLWHAVDDGELIPYEVLSIQPEFRDATYQGEEGGPQEIPDALADYKPVVVVKEGT